MTGTTASKIAGHSPGSKQAQTYCHLSVEDLESSVKEMNGIRPEDTEEEKNNCHKCGQTLAVGDGICPSCGLAHDEESASKRIEIVEEALNIRAGIKALGEKYPELGGLISGLLDKETYSREGFD